jgi:hypothetical protein
LFVLCVTSFLSAGVLCLSSACLGVASAYRAHLRRPTIIIIILAALASAA